jgi:putative membrane protein
LNESFISCLKFKKEEAFILPILIILSASALYEIMEWLVADVFFKEQGISYLGTQGDVWDSQKDTAIAFLGVVISTLLYGFYLKFLK